MELSNAVAQAQTDLLVRQFQGGFIRIFTGAPPPDPSDGEVGTLLGEVSVNGASGAPLHFVAVGPTLQKSAEPWAFVGQATGTAGWFRWSAPGDTGVNDPAALRIDGVIGSTYTPGDLNFQDTAIVEDLLYSIDDFVYLIHPTTR